MVVSKETVRFWPEEQELLVNVTGISNAAENWASMQAWANALVLTKPSLIVYHFGATGVGTSPAKCGTRLKIGNWYIVGSSEQRTSNPSDVYGIAYIPAGTYTIDYEGWNVTSAWLKLGVTNFSDLGGDVQNSDLNHTIGAAATVTVVDENITGVLRECVLGTIRRHVLRLTCCILCDTDDQSGEYLDAGDAVAKDWGASIWLDDVQKDWTNDYVQWSGMDEGGANLGEYAVEADIEATTNIKIKIENNTIGALDFDTYWSIAACPWFSIAEYTLPVLVNIPQASTIHVIAETLDDDDTTTKYIGLGTRKALAYSPVYAETSGTAIQIHNETLTERPTHGLELFLKGWRSAVSLIAADRRG